MYKTLTIGGKDYHLEYTLEASLCSDCIDRLIEFLGGVSGSAYLADDALAELDPDSRKKVIKESVQGIKNEISKLPKTAILMLYAGLQEYHGMDGDGTVSSMHDAKKIAKQYIQEHSEDGTGNFYDLFTICLNQMAEDDFFVRTGLNKIMSQAMNTEESSEPKPNRAQRRATAKVKKLSEN